jgi:hypothetical protein
VNLVAVVENIESRRPFFCLPQATLTKKELFFSNYNPTFPIIDSCHAKCHTKKQKQKC